MLLFLVVYENCIYDPTRWGGCFMVFHLPQAVIRGRKHEGNASFFHKSGFFWFSAAESYGTIVAFVIIVPFDALFSRPLWGSRT